MEKEKDPLAEEVEQAVIVPTVGRVVHYYPKKGDGFGRVGPLVALIAAVHGDRCINIAVFDGNGKPINDPPTSVTLVQPGDDVDDSNPRAEWMPYQKRKCFGSESGEQSSGSEPLNPVDENPGLNSSTAPDDLVNTPDDSVNTPDDSVNTPDDSVNTPDEGIKTQGEPNKHGIGPDVGV